MDGQTEGVDLVAEWKIADASWYEIFAKAKLGKVLYYPRLTSGIYIGLAIMITTLVCAEMP